MICKQGVLPDKGEEQDASDDERQGDDEEAHGEDEDSHAGEAEDGHHEGSEDHRHEQSVDNQPENIYCLIAPSYKNIGNIGKEKLTRWTSRCRRPGPRSPR